MKTILIVFLGSVLIATGILFWEHNSPETVPKVVHEFVENSFSSENELDPYSKLICSKDFGEVDSDSSKKYQELAINSFLYDSKLGMRKQINSFLLKHRQKLFYNLQICRPNLTMRELNELVKPQLDSINVSLKNMQHAK